MHRLSVSAFLLLLLVLSLVPGSVRAQPACLSNVCRTKFKVLLLFTSTHTWVQHGCSCGGLGGGTEAAVLGSLCPFAGPASWSTVGFEAANRKPIGPGGLRQETYTCTDPQPSTVTNTGLMRMGVQYLVERGWNDGEKAKYRIWKGLKSCADISDRNDCAPNPGGNVCWHFTCNLVDCAIRKLPANAYPPSEVTGFDLRLVNWTCPTSYFADGKYCDCNCGGATDPDCLEDLSLPSRGCPGNQICLAGNQCFSRELTIMDRKLMRALDDGEDIFQPAYVPTFAHYPPSGLLDSLWSFFGGSSLWNCPWSYYGSDDGCDYQCGGWLVDPDCKKCGGPEACAQSYAEMFTETF